MTINDTQATALGLLAQGPANPNELFARAVPLADFWSVTRSQLYRELPKLEEANMVKASEPGKRRAVTYTLTGRGKRALVDWLAEEGKMVMRDGPRVREHFRSAIGIGRTETAKRTRKAKTPTEDAPAPKKRASRKKTAEAAE